MTTAVETKTRTWTATSDLGPRMAKEFNTALANVQREARTQTELSGVIGGEERKHSFIVMGVSPFFREDAKEMLAALAERNDYTVSKSNYKGIIADLESIMKHLASTRPVTKDSRITMEEDAENKRQRAEEQRAREQADQQKNGAWQAVLAKKPANAQAVIIAELHVDKSDIQSDYFNSQVTRRVAIGWRTGSKEDFRQLRAAASQFERTKHLGTGQDIWRARAIDENGREGGWVRDADGETLICGTEAELREALEARIVEIREQFNTNHYCAVPDHHLLVNGYKVERESVEHRENYSMGSGNYLGESRHSGWHVRSRDLGYPYDVEDAIPERPATPAAGPATMVFSSADGVTVTENEEKDGVEIRFAQKPASTVLETLKTNGWRWSRFSSCWYTKRTPETLEFARKLTS